MMLRRSRQRTRSPGFAYRKIYNRSNHVQEENHQEPKKLLLRRALIDQGVDKHPYPKNAGGQGHEYEENGQDGKAAKKPIAIIRLG
jgi:hypothetical protein